MTTALSFTAAHDALRAAGMPDYIAEDVALTLTGGDGFVPEDVLWWTFNSVMRELAEA
jgi:hypothetical protein